MMSSARHSFLPFQRQSSVPLSFILHTVPQLDASCQWARVYVNACSYAKLMYLIHLMCLSVCHESKQCVGAAVSEVY